MFDTEKLEMLMHERGITAYKLAKAIGVTTSYTTRLFDGSIQNPRFDIVCKIADVLCVSVDELRIKEAEEV